jgi:hypothetical protein
MSWWQNETSTSTMAHDNNNKVTLNNFSVSITTNDQYTDLQKLTSDGYEYIAVPHNTEYKLSLSNNTNNRCDAQIYIDGESIGVWRINSYSSIMVERPANINRKFVFMREKSQSIAQKGKSENGLIKVVFKPEKSTIVSQGLDLYMNSRGRSISKKGMDYGLGAKSFFDSTDYQDNLSMTSTFSSKESYETGVTVLGGKSDQQFSSADNLHTVDTKNITTIYLRLVAQKDTDYGTKQYISLSEGNKINTNKIPPPIEKSGWFNWL